MIQPTRRLWSRVALVVFGLMAAGGVAGCAFRPAEAEVRSTPAVPIWRPDAVGRTLRALGSAGSALQRSGSTPDASQRAGRVADYLADQLHDYRVQPAASAYRLFYPRPPVDEASGLAPTYLPLVAGIVAGRDPLIADEAVIVYAALDPDPADRTVSAAWLEMGRVYAELVRFYRFPVRSIIFLMPVGANHTAALKAYGRQPVWPLEKVRAVLALGENAPGAEAWRAIGVPDSADVKVLVPPVVTGEDRPPAMRAVEMASAGYTWLLPHVGAPVSGAMR